MFEKTIKNHLTRFQRFIKTTSSYSLMKPYIERLSQTDVMSFTLLVAEQEMEKSILEHKHSYRSRKFDHLLLTISTIPIANPDIAKMFFANGYLAFVDQVLKNWDYQPPVNDFAHWILCFDGKLSSVHLTLLPASEIEEAMIIFAEDLMTLEEKWHMGIN